MACVARARRRGPWRERAGLWLAEGDLAVGVGVPGWSPELERSFKEVLYRFLEEVQSTKAAFYLLAPDGATC